MSTEIAVLAGPAALVEGIDVAGFVAYLRNERGLAVNTQLAYGRALRQFAAWAHAGGMTSYLRPTYRELGGFLEHLHGRELALSSIAQKFATVKAFYRYLHLTGAIPETILALVRLIEGPSPCHTLPAVLSPEQAARIVQAPLPSDRYFLRNRALMELLYASGVRVSEACNLALAKLHLEDRYAEVNGKGNKTRLVLLNRSAVDALRAYLHEQRPRLVRHHPESPWLFVSCSGQRLTREMVWKLVKEYARRAELRPTVSPHTMRHSFASHLMTGGADLRVIQELLGHANLDTTQNYTHVDAERMHQLHCQFHPRGAQGDGATVPRAA